MGVRLCERPGKGRAEGSTVFEKGVRKRSTRLLHSCDVGRSMWSIQLTVDF